MSSKKKRNETVALPEVETPKKEALTEVKSEPKETIKKPKEVSAKGNLMYLGPTITGVVRHSTVFKDGELPKKATQCIEQFPVMERLFVELDSVPKTMKELNKKESAIKTVYDLVAQKFSRR